MQHFVSPILLIVTAFWVFISVGQATTSFDLPTYVEPGKASIGIEPVFALTNGSGASLNAKARYGVNELLNLGAMIGTGTGAREFRLGMVADFEWFPDMEGQPGIATPFFTEYYRFRDDGLITFGLKPLVYKTFVTDHGDFTPFVSIPFGWNYCNQRTRAMIQTSFGTVYRLPQNEHIRFVVETGFNVKHAYSYISGGVSFLQ